MINTACHDEMAAYVGKRKHGTHLNSREIKGLYERLKSVKHWDYANSHIKKRMVKKGIFISEYVINRMLNDSYIIEYKIDDFRGLDIVERIVLRSNHTYNKGHNLIIVLNLTKEIIVTTWFNHEDDNHKTIDWENYDKDMKVFGI